MSLNRLRFLTAGESHGKGLTVVVEGFPAGLALSEEYMVTDLARRQKGYGRGGRMLIEKDFAEIMAGVRQGYTLGSPIALWIQNKDWDNWKGPMSITKTEKAPNKVTRLRPGHADLPGVLKYKQDDVRNILERASARETAARVAVGAIARRFLDEFGIVINAHVLSIGTVDANIPEVIDWDKVEESPVRCADPVAEKAMMAAIDDAKETGNTLGGVFEVVAVGLPIGLGSHIQWDTKLDGRIAQAMMSIHAIKGVEIGDGFGQTRLMGSKVHDIIVPWSEGGRKWRRRSNHAGGLEGGITNGMPVTVKAAIKPISTLKNPLPSVDLVTGETGQAHYERSDVCQVRHAQIDTEHTS